MSRWFCGFLDCIVYVIGLFPYLGHRCRGRAESVTCTEGGGWHHHGISCRHPAPLPADSQLHFCREELHHHLPSAHRPDEEFHEVDSAGLWCFYVCCFGYHYVMLALLPENTTCTYMTPEVTFIILASFFCLFLNTYFYYRKQHLFVCLTATGS